MLPGRDERHPLRDEQLRDPRVVVGLPSVRQGPRGPAARREPVGGRRVQADDLFGMAAPQVEQQMRAQERVDAVRGAALAEAPRERGLPLQRRQHLTGVRAAGQRDGETGGELVADADGPQHLGGAGRQGRQDLPDQVVGDGLAVAREVGEEAVDVARLAQRQRREPQARRPTGGLVHQRAHLPGRQDQVRAGEQRGRLVRGEGEVAGADLAELARQAQPRDRQRRVGAPREHEPQRARTLPDQCRQGPHRRRARRERVDVVEDQVDRAGNPVERLEQPDQEAVLRRVEPVQRGTDRSAAAQGGEHGRPETWGDAVVVVERQPGDPVRPPRGPLGEQQRLAVPGRGADEQQPTRLRGVEQGEQPGAADVARGDVRHRRLRLRYHRIPLPPRPREHATENGRRAALPFGPSSGDHARRAVSGDGTRPARPCPWSPRSPLRRGSRARRPGAG